MFGVRLSLKLCGVIVLAAIALRSDSATRAADKDAPKPVSGILVDTNDKWIKVKTDGDEEPTQYTIGDAEKKMMKSANIFTVQRVQVTYKLDGSTRQLVSIRKLPSKGAGTVTGEVLAVYNNFWVEVKPKDGPPDWKPICLAACRWWRSWPIRVRSCRWPNDRPTPERSKCWRRWGPTCTSSPKLTRSAGCWGRASTTSASYAGPTIGMCG